MTTLRRQLVWFVATFLLNPLIAWWIGDVVRRRAVDAFTRAGVATDGAACSTPAALASVALQHVCDVYSESALLKSVSLGVALAGLVLPLLYILVARSFTRRPELMGKLFPWIVRGGVGGVFGILALQGGLLVAAAYELLNSGYGPRVPTEQESNSIGSFLSSLGMDMVRVWPLWVLAYGVALLVGAYFLLAEGRKALVITRPMLRGVTVSRAEHPLLWQRLERLAAVVDAPLPDHVLAGLEPTAFVVGAAVDVYGAAAPLEGMTLYIGAPLIDIFTGDELDAVLAHELAHFRHGDHEYTVQFLPAYASLRRALGAVVSPDEEEPAFLKLARMPAVSMLANLFVVMQTQVRGAQREREFKADRVAAEATSAEAAIRALVKLVIVYSQWSDFRKGNQSLVNLGRRRADLSLDLCYRVVLLVHRIAGDKLQKAVLDGTPPHPLDSHPPIRARAAALGIDAIAAYQAVLAALREGPVLNKEGRSLGTAATDQEVAWARLPGQVLELDAEAKPPPELLGITARQS